MSSPQSNANSTRPSAWSHHDGWRAGGLFLAVLLVYAPVWQAGFVWDDGAMLTANPCIVGPHGVREIWTTHFADICPLTLSALWAEHALWGLTPVPYHVVNVLLHGVGALLLWRVLRGLQTPGAFLGAAIWALHPVEVESVAWVTEMKNTLSGVFFLGAILFFLRGLNSSPPVGPDGSGQRRRSWPSYGLCVGCTALAMASKSSTVVLPVVLGLCAWWVEGRVRWRRVVSLGPLMLLAAAASALSLWTQGTSLALTHDAQWARSGPDRLAAAGGAVWFYLGKLLWPHPLAAVYPRWQVNAGRWVEWLPLLAAAGVLLLLWRQRRSPWGRACFLTLAYFLTALLPALGLFDNTIFRYSLVFDHFQYLASMGPLALAGAGVTRLARLALPDKVWWQGVASAVLLLGLGTLTSQRSGVYRDEVTFWTDTLVKNPRCWPGHSNLGSALLLKGQVDAALTHYEQALAINPNYAEAHNNLGIIFLRQRKIERAIGEYERAVAILPSYAEAYSNLGNAWLAKGHPDQAIAGYEKALALNPDYHTVHFGLGNAWLAKGQADEAIAQYARALAADPNYAEAHSNLGNAFLAKRQFDEAIAHYEKALHINPNYAEAHNNLGVAFLRTARFDEATAQFQEALRLAPDYPNVQNNLATARMLARRARPAR